MTATPPDDTPTPLPEGPSYVADEMTTLEAFLDYHRAVFIRKADGLTDEQARRPACPPSELTVMGLVRHMADVERSWFRRCLAAEVAEPIYYGPAHPDGDVDGDFHPGVDDTLAEAVVSWRHEVDMARANVRGRSPDDLAKSSRDRSEPRPSTRWILVHMIEEYARHCGHLDLLREAIDGVTGD